ncbi:MAG: dipeptidase [Azospirillaceae bacterium]
MTAALSLHDRAIVIDAVCPLLRTPSTIDLYIEGGLTLVAPTIASVEGARYALGQIALWKGLIAADERLVQAHTAADIEAAKEAGKTAILMHFQGADPIESDLDLVFAYKDLGVGIIQLCYNVRNHVGDGADERTDSGLSYFGVKLVRRLNEARVIVDCSHTGERTTLDAVETSAAPVVVSHGNPRALHASRRNITDEMIRAIAGSGGLVGIVGFPGFVDSTNRPSLDRFVDHIAYVADLVGIDHVGLGIDYYNGQAPIVSDEEAMNFYQAALKSGVWRPDTYPPPPHHYPAGIETPATLANLTARLLERGFGEEAALKVLGGNWMRVYRAVWGA